MHVDLVIADGLELGHRCQHIPLSPPLGLVAIGDARERDDPAALEGATLLDRELTTVGRWVAVHGTGKNTTAGRENRVRRVGERLDDELAPYAVCLPDAPDDRQIGRRHVTRSAMKHAKRRRRVVELDIEAPGPADALDRAFAVRELDRAFDRLSTDDRTILTLRHLWDLPGSEIAQHLGIPEGTVKSRVHAAMNRLRAAYEAEERR